MGAFSTLADNVDCYSVGNIKIGCHSTVSQYTYLCSATHDYCDPSIMHERVMPLLIGPIVIGERVWITADVFVGPGVQIGDGTVVLARSTVVKDLPPWKVAAGTPAVVLRDRELRETPANA